MKLYEIINHVDNVKPNAFEPPEKTVWLNELEYDIQINTLGLTEGMTVHNWGDNWSGTGVTFPDDATVILPERLRICPGGQITLGGCTGIPANNVDGVRVLTVTWEGDATTLTVAEGTFTAGDEEGTVRLGYDGREEEMVLPEQFHKVYYTWLLAQVEWNSGEYNAYANTMQMYNSYWGEYQRWYARTYIDPED